MFSLQSFTLLLFSKDGTIICLKYMDIFVHTCKANSHSCSHLLLKIHIPGQDYCSGDCVTLSPLLLTIEWLGWLSGGTFERCQIIKTCHLLCKLSISCAKHILFLLWPRSNRKCAKIIMAAKRKEYSPCHARVIHLRPACIQ